MITHLEVYLEPGEAIALNAGSLVTTVREIIDYAPPPIAIIDASAECHAPDVIEMPYRPPLKGAGLPFGSVSVEKCVQQFIVSVEKCERLYVFSVVKCVLMCYNVRHGAEGP